MTSKLNIYDYLTPDAAARCQKIGHLFSPLDMAVIVQHSGKTVRDKLAAWQTIIDGGPDMPIGGNGNFKPRESLHEYLRGYIQWHEKAVADFHSHGEGIIFRPHAYWTHRDKNSEEDYDIGCYSTLGRALGAAQSKYPESEWPETELRKIEIYKGRIDGEFSDDELAVFNAKGELTEIYFSCGMPEEDLKDIFIHAWL